MGKKMQKKSGEVPCHPSPLRRADPPSSHEEVGWGAMRALTVRVRPWTRNGMTWQQAGAIGAPPLLPLNWPVNLLVLEIPVFCHFRVQAQEECFSAAGPLSTLGAGPNPTILVESWVSRTSELICESLAPPTRVS